MRFMRLMGAPPEHILRRCSRPLGASHTVMRSAGVRRARSIRGSPVLRRRAGTEWVARMVVIGHSSAAADDGQLELGTVDRDDQAVIGGQQALVGEGVEI